MEINCRLSELTYANRANLPIMDEVWKLSLVTGWLPAAITILGLVALCLLLLLPPYSRRWWLIGAIVIAGSGLVVWAVAYYVDNVAKLFPDRLPTTVLLWSWMALAGIGLAIARIPRWRWWGVAALVAGLIAAVGGATQINRFYGEFPTLGTALGVTRTKTVDLTQVDKPAARTLAAPAGGYLADVWQPPADLPAKGTVSKVTIPGTISGFHPRQAFVYLPPAYQSTSPRPLLPVLVLLSGQPGAPDGWLISGELPAKMDAFAAAHHGLAPIVVMPDDLGNSFANPLCLDSKLGNVQTYLTRDVPNWINVMLEVAKGRDSWAIAGLSHGGTCSLQMAVNAPDVYGRFIDISGQREPTLGSRQRTVDAAFGGDEAAFTRVNPLDVMQRQRFPQTAAIVVGGSEDADYLPQAKEVYAAAKAAGMNVTFQELQGGHDWRVWGGGLFQNLGWLAQQTRLAPQ